ncbi:hypothetical protein F0562_019249 [Nyssa sinensis]|uniref:Uncharacterized protein n=1 Tax=Nyssa sinensis TaxID=561372 RepID=A0A5J4ZCC0_9ASTE|nr:hypothetical protein F0562_019249 [Nyssa sinensis]
MENADLHDAPSTVLVAGEDGEYLPVRNFEDARNICYIESLKLWAIAVGYGKCTGDTLWTGIWCRASTNAGGLHAKVVDNPICGMLLHNATLHLCCAGPKTLGQRDDIAELAGKFSIQVIPQMFSLAINFPTQKFLQAQSKVGFLAWVGFAALFIHIGVLYLFINVFRWGMTGAAVAYDISAWGVALAQVVYTVGWCKDGWKGLSWLAFKDMWEFVKLSVASAVMLCLEIWYFMTIIVLTGHLADPIIAVGSLSICMNLNGWEAMLFIGINAAISVRISNELGSGHPRAAKYSVIVTVSESLLIGIICMAIVMTTKNHFAIIFTDSKEMQQAVAHLAYLLAYNHGAQ